MLCDDLQRQSDKLFNDRTQLLSFWQEIADHFYPERADFTVTRNIGTDFAAGLMSSYPLLVRRDLGNSFGSMLRPAGKSWFRMSVSDDEGRIDIEARKWLEWATGVMRRAMYDRHSNFVRAMKEGDHDFAAFGNAAITTEVGPDGATMLYRTWHLRDVAWAEGPNSLINMTYQKWKPSAATLMRMFPKTVPQQIRDKMERDPLCEIPCMRAVMTADAFGDSKYRDGWVSVYWTCEPKAVLEVRPLIDTVWTIPRWQTVSGSQYGHSPSTVCALPDARLLQAMTRVILEVGEKFTNPPLVAVQEAIRGDVQMMSGGITWVDSEYDERLGEVLRPLTQDKSGLSGGLELRAQIEVLMREAFFLNKIEMPSKVGEMTAYEVSQRVQEYIRQALPLFEPMEAENNASICEHTFGTMMRSGAFGPIDTIPRSLQGQDIVFRFESPLQAALDSEKVAQLQQAKSALSLVADIDPSTVHIFDARSAFRDALRGAQVPAAWTRSERDVDAIVQQNAQNEQAEMEMAAMVESSNVAKNLAGAKALSEQRTRAR